MEAIRELFITIWQVWDTPISLPVIGQTSGLRIFLTLAAFAIIVDLLVRLYAGDGD